MQKIIVLGLSLLTLTGVSLSARAAQEQLVLRTTAESSPGDEFHLKVILEKNEQGELVPTATRYITWNWDGEKWSQTRNLVFSLKALKKGAVLDQVYGRDVFTLTLGKNFDQKKGGTLHIDYLYEGGLFSNDYRRLDVWIEPDAKGDWGLWKFNDSKWNFLNQMYLKTRWVYLFGDWRSLGVEEIQTSITQN